MKELVDCYRGEVSSWSLGRTGIGCWRSWLRRVCGSESFIDSKSINSYIEFEVIESSTSTVEPRLMQPKLLRLQ